MVLVTWLTCKLATLKMQKYFSSHQTLIKATMTVCKYTFSKTIYKHICLHL